MHVQKFVKNFCSPVRNFVLTYSAFMLAACGQETTIVLHETYGLRQISPSDGFESFDLRWGSACANLRRQSQGMAQIELLSNVHLLEMNLPFHQSNLCSCNVQDLHRLSNRHAADRSSHNREDCSCDTPTCEGFDVIEHMRA